MKSAYYYGNHIDNLCLLHSTWILSLLYLAFLLGILKILERLPQDIDIFYENNLNRLKRITIHYIFVWSKIFSKHGKYMKQTRLTSTVMYFCLHLELHISYRFDWRMENNQIGMWTSCPVESNHLETFVESIFIDFNANK